MAIRNVVLVGANGNLGQHILEALVKSDRFRITVIKRASSKSTLAHTDKICIVEVPDTWTVNALRNAMQGEDAVIACFPLRNLDDHLRLVEAAAAAGVRRVIPADFGSADSRSRRARELVPLFDKKVLVRERLEHLGATTPDFTWTSIVGGHFFDWGLENNFLHFNIATKKAEILDDGNRPSSLSTLGRLSEAVVRVLEKESETANKMLFIQSFCVSQNDVLESLEKATNSKWDVEPLESEAFIKHHKALADAGNTEAVEDLVFALGAIDGNWEEKPEFSMDLLGLKNEDLDAVVVKVVSTCK